MNSSIWGFLVGRAGRTYSDRSTGEKHTRNILQYTLVRRVRNYPRRVAAGDVLVEVGQRVIVGIEQVRCDIGRITACEDGEIDHRER